jgi:hypothetical protein
MAVLLTVASPVFFADGISYYSMSAHLLANTLYALLLVAPTFRKALAAGLIGSVALTLHNPVPHMLFALPWIVALFRRPDGLRLGFALFAGYLPLCLVLGLGWFLLTSPSAGTIAHLSAPSAAAIAHAGSPFAWPTSTVLLARAIGIAKVWAWTVPGMVVLAVIGAWKWRRDEPCLLLTASALLTLVGYVFVPFDQGHGWGYRYFHSAWIALPILAAAALTPLSARLAGATARPRPDRLSAAAITPRPARRLAAATDRMTAGAFEDVATRTFLVACALFSLIAGTGLRAVQMREFIAKHQSQMPAYSGTEHRVIILDTRHSFYGRDLVQNDPWLRDNAIVMITHGQQADAAAMQENYPEMHRVYTDQSGSVWSAATP